MPGLRSGGACGFPDSPKHINRATTGLAPAHEVGSVNERR